MQVAKAYMERVVSQRYSEGRLPDVPPDVLHDIVLTLQNSGSVLVQDFLLQVVKKLMHIDDTLSNLRYLHILILSATASVLNGVVHNVVYVWQDKVKTEDFFANAAAMVLGDFLGCFIVIMFFNLCIDLAFRLTVGKRRENQSGVRFVANLLNRTDGAST